MTHRHRAALVLVVVWTIASLTGALASPARAHAEAPTATLATVVAATVSAGSSSAPASGRVLAAPVEEPSTTTSTTQASSAGDDEDMDEETIVFIVVGGLVGVALGLTVATWWYVRATRPVLPE